MLKMLMHCHYVGQVEIITTGQKVKIKNGDNIKEVTDKGIIKQSNCPYFGECSYSKNQFICDTFSNLPRYS